MSKKQPAKMFIENFEELNGRKFFVCSDSHYSHSNIVFGTSNWEDKTGCRGFVTLEEHNQVIVGGINGNVGTEDVLIHLGDWSFGGKDRVKEFRDKVNCKRIILLYGNHDVHIRTNKELQDLFFWCGDYLEMKYMGKFFTMSHYPIGSWNNIGKGAINLHGHCHGNYKSNGKQIDCGPESIGYLPIFLGDIIERMKRIRVETVDHHNEKTRTHY